MSLIDGKDCVFMVCIRSDSLLLVDKVYLCYGIGNSYFVKNNNILHIYPGGYFISLSEYRDNQIDKLI